MSVLCRHARHCYFETKAAGGHQKVSSAWSERRTPPPSASKSKHSFQQTQTAVGPPSRGRVREVSSSFMAPDVLRTESRERMISGPADAPDISSGPSPQGVPGVHTCLLMYADGGPGDGIASPPPHLWVAGIGCSTRDLGTGERWEVWAPAQAFVFGVGGFVRVWKTKDSRATVTYEEEIENA